MDKQALAYRIRAFRKLKGFTQTELADLLGVSIAIVGTIERGTRRPDPRMLKRIAEALGIDQEELIPVEIRAKGE
ncbi:helix-turn-helix domain-containing protein [Gorillibacterium sp. sgz5001074]|uniref:helix-turn-helix domain-containing protein n=1 Tax=Gorillibacterium sp. sgz5001074 TaxID=3446695 RepID=UPI003F68152C